MKKVVLLFVVILSIHNSFSQRESKKYKIRTVAFYNLENLFDTINDVNKFDEASPIMELKTNKSKVYWDKIDKLGEVILQIGEDKAKNSPALLGVAEVENATVLSDLVKSKKLKKKNYGYIHFDSPDSRGIDVALLYQKRYFKPVHYEAFNPNIYVENKKIKTRDILWVNGYLDDEEINIIVNHWPSRRGGEAKSRPMRERAAYKVTKIIERIRQNDENAKIIIMGDFNDDPINSSFKKVLKTKKDRKNVEFGEIYNPFEEMFSKGYNTLGYRDNINLFDQILVTYPLISATQKKGFYVYKMYKAGIFNKRFLIQKRGRYKGYPFRSFSNGRYTGGYSDHYPVYMYLLKEEW